MNVDEKHISPEVVEAAARAAYEVIPHGVSAVGWLPWEEVGEHIKEHYRAEARAAIAAALNAWPGMSQLAENDSASIREMAALILPLPQQASDDQ